MALKRTTPAKPAATAKPEDKPEDKAAANPEVPATPPETPEIPTPSPTPAPVPVPTSSAVQTVTPNPAPAAPLAEAELTKEPKAPTPAQVAKAESELNLDPALAGTEEGLTERKQVLVRNNTPHNFRQPSTGKWIEGHSEEFLLDDGWLSNQCRASLLTRVRKSKEDKE